MRWHLVVSLAALHRSFARGAAFSNRSLLGWIAPTACKTVGYLLERKTNSRMGELQQSSQGKAKQSPPVPGSVFLVGCS